MAGEIAGGIQGGLQAGLATGNPYAAVAGAVVGAIGGHLGGQARAAMRRAERARRRQEQLVAFRERVNAQRQANAQRAEVIQAAASDNTLGSSGVQGALSGAGSQLNAAFGFANAMDYQSTVIRKNTRKAQVKMDRSQLVGGLLQAATSFAGRNMPTMQGSGAPTEAAEPGQMGELQMPSAPSFFYNDGQPAQPSFFSSNPVFKL